MQSLEDWLERVIFSRLVALAESRIHTAFLVVLWVAILIFGFISVVALEGGNYFNGLCGIVACILMARQNRHHSHLKGEVAKLHEKIDRLAQPSTAPARDPKTGRFTKRIQKESAA